MQTGPGFSTKIITSTQRSLRTNVVVNKIVSLTSSNEPDEDDVVVTLVDGVVVTTEAAVEADTVDGGTVTESSGVAILVFHENSKEFTRLSNCSFLCWCSTEQFHYSNPNPFIF